MRTNRGEMDKAINDHFGFEAADNLDGVMASLADEVEHEVVPSPVGVQHEKAQVRDYYAMLFASVKGEGVTPLKRYYGEDFVVDETMWHGQISDGRAFLCDGKSGKVSFRLLHIFEFKNGKIAREQAWCDLAAIQRQLGVKLS
ncbi:MAG: nuclear transport factor 2 family protein [Alphaproteobacteria bacterium]|nr:nuclear transport factor 2 family protein [Alphaproteobacteria bacterium]